MSIQSPNTISFGDLFKNSSPLLLPSNILWLFYQNAHLGSQCSSFFLSDCEYFHIRQKIWPSHICQELGCDTVHQARHRTTSTDNLVPPYSPPNKKTSISTHRQTSTPLSKCHYRKIKKSRIKLNCPTTKISKEIASTWVAEWQFQLQISWLYSFPSM